MNSISLKFTDLLKQIDPEFSLSERQLTQLQLYYENLVEWNNRINLTAITEEEDVYIKHYLDSYTLFIVVPRETIKNGMSIIDIGTGAGFPGIPLAIALPEVNFTLMDSLGKRIRFLENMVGKLNLENVTCIQARAEDLARDRKHREQYDIAVSRAVANLSTLSEYCVPFLRVGGEFVAYKSEKVKEGNEQPDGEKAAKKLGAQFIRQEEFVLPGTEYHRTLLMFRKTHSTPNTYPRRAGTPSRNPLN